MLPDIIDINQDADGLIPEEIAKECEQRLKDGRPMPKVSEKIAVLCQMFFSKLQEIMRKQLFSFVSLSLFVRNFLLYF